MLEEKTKKKQKNNERGEKDAKVKPWKPCGSTHTHTHHGLLKNKKISKYIKKDSYKT